MNDPIIPDVPVVYVHETYVPSPQRLGGQQYRDNCVMYAKWLTSRSNESWGIAKRIVPTSQTPYVGAVVLLNEGSLGHVAVITRIDVDLLYITEANYIHGKITTRVIPIDYPLIRGYK